MKKYIVSPDRRAENEKRAENKKRTKKIEKTTPVAQGQRAVSYVNNGDVDDKPPVDEQSQSQLTEANSEAEGSQSNYNPQAQNFFAEHLQSNSDGPTPASHSSSWASLAGRGVLGLIGLSLTAGPGILYLACPAIFFACVQPVIGFGCLVGSFTIVDPYPFLLYALYLAIVLSVPSTALPIVAVIGCAMIGIASLYISVMGFSKKDASAHSNLEVDSGGGTPSRSQSLS